MVKFQTLSDGLAFVYEHQSTGRLSVTGKQGKCVKVCTILVRGGEIVGAQHRDKEGYEAITFLLSLESSRAIFFEASAGDFEGKSDLPSTADLFKKITDNCSGIAQRNVGTAQAFDIKGEVTHLLEELLGSPMSKKIDKVAQKYPPTRQPFDFLSSCEEMFASIFGSTVAKYSFDRLYGRLIRDEREQIS